jgi:DNA polymerase-3 subunit gamma/tau
LTDVCSACLGRQVTVSIREGNQKDRQDKKKKKTENDRLKQAMLDHPLVSEAIEIFNGKVVDVKVNK